MSVGVRGGQRKQHHQEYSKFGRQTVQEFAELPKGYLSIRTIASSHLTALKSAASIVISQPAQQWPTAPPNHYLIMLSKDLVWVKVPLLSPSDPTKRVEGKLPMVDPHEYINYLLSTKRVVVSPDDIQMPGRTQFVVLRYWLQSAFQSKTQEILEPFSISECSVGL